MPLDFSFEKLEKKQYNLHLRINKSHLDNINDLFFKSKSNLLSRVKFYSINKFSKLTFSQYIKNIEIDKDKIVSNLKIISKEKIINMCEKKHYQSNFIDIGLKLINVDREVAVNFKDFKMLI
ncbi:MAG: hypothetical protein LC122_12470 [Chitinophagales bacterium]|nr:hypothetical protein [Chitinophagales bacterium]